MLEQKPQILRGVALMSRGGLHILYIDLDFNIEYAANSVYDKNKWTYPVSTVEYRLCYLHSY